MSVTRKPFQSWNPEDFGLTQVEGAHSGVTYNPSVWCHGRWGEEGQKVSLSRTGCHSRGIWKEITAGSCPFLNRSLFCQQLFVECSVLGLRHALVDETGRMGALVEIGVTTGTGGQPITPIKRPLPSQRRGADEERKKGSSWKGMLARIRDPRAPRHTEWLGLALAQTSRRGDSCWVGVRGRGHRLMGPSSNLTGLGHALHPITKLSLK